MGVCQSNPILESVTLKKRPRSAGPGQRTKSFLETMDNLPQGKNVIAEYVWIDGQAMQKGELESPGMRSKQRTLQDYKITKVSQLPEWNFDGSSCYQATRENSEIILKPVAFYPDPFKSAGNIIVLCEAFKWTDKTYKTLVPCGSNLRHFANKIFEKVEKEKCWFGIEQEYTILEQKSQFKKTVHGWPKNGFPGA